MPPPSEIMYRELQYWGNNGSRIISEISSKFNSECWEDLSHYNTFLSGGEGKQEQ